MPFEMTDLLRDYDVYPKVFRCGKEAVIHVRPTGCRPQFVPGKTYRLVICALENGQPSQFPLTADFRSFDIAANDEGGFAHFKFC